MRMSYASQAKARGQVDVARDKGDVPIRRRIQDGRSLSLVDGSLLNCVYSGSRVSMGMGSDLESA